MMLHRKLVHMLVVLLLGHVKGGSALWLTTSCPAFLLDNESTNAEDGTAAADDPIVDKMLNIIIVYLLMHIHLHYHINISHEMQHHLMMNDGDHLIHLRMKFALV
jgi:hypothetical protein